MKQDYQKSPDSLESRLDALFKSQMDSEVDSKAIVEKTLAKIRRDRVRRRARIGWVSSLSVAASVFIGLAVYYLAVMPEKVEHADLRQLAGCMSEGVCNTEHVMLITPDKQLWLSENALVQYDAQGTAQVNGKDALKSDSPDEVYCQLVVPAGKRARLQLADGTLLTLNAMSRVVYPQKFEGAERRIYAEGEVYLEVAPNKAHPFIVESSDFDLRVLGTKFNISTYKELKETQIVLVEGSVEVTESSGRTKAVLKPDEMLSLEKGRITDCRQVDASDYISWTKGWLPLKGELLTEIVKRLSIHYGVGITCKTSAGSKKMYGKLELKEDYKDVLDCIRQIVPLEVHYDGKNVELRDN